MSVQASSKKLEVIIASLTGSRGAEVLDRIGRDVVEETQDVILQMHVYKSGDTYESVEWKREGRLDGYVRVNANRDGYRYPIRIHEGYITSTGKWVAGRPFLRVAMERIRQRQPAYWRKLFE